MVGLSLEIRTILKLTSFSLFYIWMRPRVNFINCFTLIFRAWNRSFMLQKSFSKVGRRVQTVWCRAQTSLWNGPRIEIFLPYLDTSTAFSSTDWKLAMVFVVARILIVQAFSNSKIISRILCVTVMWSGLDSSSRELAALRIAIRPVLTSSLWSSSQLTLSRRWTMK